MLVLLLLVLLLLLLLLLLVLVVVRLLVVQLLLRLPRRRVLPGPAEPLHGAAAAGSTAHASGPQGAPAAAAARTEGLRCPCCVATDSAVAQYGPAAARDAAGETAAWHAFTNRGASAGETAATEALQSGAGAAIAEVAGLKLIEAMAHRAMEGRLALGEISGVNSKQGRRTG